jgi:hypothetical protein
MRQDRRKCARRQRGEVAKMISLVATPIADGLVLDISA